MFTLQGLAIGSNGNFQLFAQPIEIGQSIRRPRVFVIVPPHLGRIESQRKRHFAHVRARKDGGHHTTQIAIWNGESEQEGYSGNEINLMNRRKECVLDPYRNGLLFQGVGTVKGRVASG